MDTSKQVMDQGALYVQMQNQISQDIPKMIAKTQERLYDKIEKVQHSLKSDFENQLDKATGECGLES